MGRHSCSNIPSLTGINGEDVQLTHFSSKWNLQTLPKMSVGCTVLNTDFSTIVCGLDYLKELTMSGQWWERQLCPQLLLLLVVPLWNHWRELPFPATLETYELKLSQMLQIVRSLSYWVKNLRKRQKCYSILKMTLYQ